MRHQIAVNKDKSSSKFKCDKARKSSWDKFKLTGGYSPRSEVYLYARQFVDMWRELVGKKVQPYSTYLMFCNFYVF